MLTTVIPAMTVERVRYYETVIADSAQGLLQRMQTILGNPQRVEFFHRGYTRAHLVAKMPEMSWMNRAYLPPYDDGELLAELVAFFDKDVVPPCLRIVPDHFSARVARLLAQQSLYHCGFQTVLHGIPRINAEASSPDIEIVRANRKDDFESSVEVLYRSHGFSERETMAMVSICRSWLGMKNYQFYVARIDGHDVAHAMMYLHDGVAYLGSAGVLPEFRGRGCHRALIEQRILDAAESGCELVLASSEFESSARFNLELCGLSIAYLAADWQRF